MKAIRGTVIIDVGSSESFKDSISLGEQKLYFAGEERATHNAFSFAKVVASGDDRIGVGDEVGIAYWGFDAKYDKQTGERYYLNRIEVGGSFYFVLPIDAILCKIKGNEYEAFGNNVFMRSIEHKPKDGTILTFGEDTRIEVNREVGVAAYYSGDVGVDLDRGDRIYFKERMRSEYTFKEGDGVFVVMPRELCTHYERVNFKKNGKERKKDRAL